MNSQTRTDCPYLAQVYRNLPRLLATFDRDHTSQTYGLGDRFYWSWKLIDFANGTFQGAANGLARLIAHDLLPEYLSEQAAMKRIKMMLAGAKAATARNGSLAESLPNEGSFCVTALVAVDILETLVLLEDRLDEDSKKQALDIVRPWIEFLHKQDESHGIISNHLAVAVLALVLWQDVTGENCKKRAKIFLDRILLHRSNEGWFREYDGADPGYQSWLMSTFVKIHIARPDWQLLEPIKKSFDFLQYFAHPDGSFGGIYGSRNTRFCFPASFEAMTTTYPAAQAMAEYFRAGIEGHALVTLDAFDASNMVPLFNDYVWAAAQRADNEEKGLPPAPKLPMQQPPFRKIFKQAGLLIDHGERHYSIISVFKGGALLHFKGQQLDIEDPGVVCQNEKESIVTAQYIDNENEFEPDKNHCRITAPLRLVSRRWPTPFEFIILRTFSLTVFHSLFLGNLVKKALATLLVTCKPKAVGQVVRHIEFGKDIQINDAIMVPKGYKQLDEPAFRAIHMASQGYWQKSDDR